MERPQPPAEGTSTGDARYQPHYDRVLHAEDRAAMLRAMASEEVIQALAGASRATDPLLADVLATEALNRMRRVRTAVQHMGEGVCLVDAQGRILLFNPAAERLTGWPRSEAEGRPIEQVVLPSGRWLEAYEARRVLHFEEEPFVRKGGSAFPTSCTFAPVLGDGAPDGVVILFRDVTAEKRAAAAQRAWQRHMEAFYEAHDLLGEGLLLVTDLRVTHANAAFRRMSGYGMDELRAFPDVTWLAPPEHRPEMAERMLRCQAKKARQERERLWLLRKDGGVALVEVAAITVHSDGGPAEVVCIVREAEPEAWPAARAEADAGVSVGRPGRPGPAARP